MLLKNISQIGVQLTRARSSAAVEDLFQTALVDVEFSKAKPYSDVPGPKPVPILGNTWRLLPIIGQYQISDIAKISFILYKTYGKIVTLRGLIGRPDLLFVYDADEIEKIYRQEGPTPYRPSMPCLVKYKSEVRKDFFGRLPGVVGVHGEPWREFRSKVQKPVLQPQIVKQYIKPIEEITEDFISKMMLLRDEWDELPSDFDNEVHKWSLECLFGRPTQTTQRSRVHKNNLLNEEMTTTGKVVCFANKGAVCALQGIGQVALDVRLGCLNPDLNSSSEPQKIINAAKYALRNIALLELKFPFWRYLPSTLWRKYVQNMDYFIEICMKYIECAINRLNERDTTKDGDFSLIERILVTEKDPNIACVLALDLILVGIDTISMAVCSILYQIATRPEEQEKIYEELKRILPNPTDKLSAKALHEMNYLKAFIKEVFRMYSTVIGNGRTLQQDMVICGYRIPKGTQLVFPTLVLGRMSKYVNEPDIFKPDRWLKESLDENTLHPFASLPYGHGPRMCLGRRFADLELQILLSKLLRRYKLEYHHKPLEYKVTFMYAPDGELKFKMIPREI